MEVIMRSHLLLGTLTLASTLLFGCTHAVLVGFVDDKADAGSGATADSGDQEPDGGTMFVPTDGSADAGASHKFFVLTTETPPGNPPLNTWGGILRFDIADDNAPAIPGKGIAAKDVADPAGLAFRKKSAELFVGNRHGNTGEDGTLGSVSRFRYDAQTETFTANGTITGNGMARVHQIAFSPNEDELFVVNRDDGISRFKLDAKGNATPNGHMASGWMRGVAIAPDGKRLYATTAGDVIRQFDLANGAVEIATVQVATGANLHFMSIIDTKQGDPQLYAPGTSNGVIYRYKITANDDLVLVDTTIADNPISIALSPDGLELFAAGHINSDLVARFKASQSKWIATTKIATPSALGSTLVFPASAVPDPN